VATDLGIPENELQQLFGQISYIGIVALDEVTLAQIGEVLGVTESRVCQIQTKAVMQLRGRLLMAER
jgi:DNA-directed RNA polymerase specialized sigma subunit